MKPRHEAAQDPAHGHIQFAISTGTHHLAGQVSSEEEYVALITLFAGWHRDADFPARTIPTWVQEPTP